MSRVTNWLLLPNVCEQEYERIAEVNAALEASGSSHRPPYPRPYFNLLDPDSWGGPKFPDMAVFGMTMNYGDKDIVLQAIASANWDDPVMLLYNGQEDEDWHVYILTKANMKAPKTLN